MSQFAGDIVIRDGQHVVRILQKDGGEFLFRQSDQRRMRGAVFVEQFLVAFWISLTMSFLFGICFFAMDSDDAIVATAAVIFSQIKMRKDFKNFLALKSVASSLETCAKLDLLAMDVETKTQ